jgi:curli biogenesis system outer membrane secretion channel CsgG
VGVLTFYKIGKSYLEMEEGKMNRWVVSVVISVFSLSGAFAGTTSVSEAEIPVYKCSSPVMTVALGDVDCKAKACTAPNSPQQNILAQIMGGSGSVQSIGKGLGDMLITALKESNCFKVIDLDRFNRLKKKLEATGQKIKPPKIDKFINLTITDIELSRSSGALGGGFIPVLGAIKKDKQSAKLSVDVSTLDPSTLEVDFARSFSANSEETSWGLFGAGAAGGAAAGGGWSWSKNLALDAVARDVIIRAVDSLAEKYAHNSIIERPVIIKKKPKKASVQSEGSSGDLLSTDE